MPARRLAVWRMSGLVLILCLCGIMLFAPALPTAHADGGAPNLAYVAGGGQGISIIDIIQQKVSGTIPIAGNPTSVFLSNDGRYLYVAQTTLNKVTKLLTSTHEVVCSADVAGQPSLLTFDPGVNRLYVAGQGASNITALDANTCAIKQVISTSGPVYGMALAAIGTSGPNGGDSNQIWFSTEKALNSFQLPDKIESIAVSEGPQYITVPPGATVYATTRQGHVIAVSLQTREVLPSLVTGGEFGPMDYDANTQQIYVPDKKRNQIVVLNPVYYSSNLPKEPNHIINLDIQPQSVAITSDGNLAFFALANGTVAMYDIFGKQMSETFNVGGAPRFVITGLYPPAAPQTPTANGQPIPVNILYILVAVAMAVLIVIVILIILARRKGIVQEE